MFVLAIAGLTLQSCATITKSSKAEVRLNSTPAGANVSIGGVDYGTTPTTAKLARDQSHVATFTLDGYETFTLPIEKKFDGATTILGNLVSWSLLGILVDIGSGKAYSLAPADLEANMSSLQSSGLLDTAKLKEGEIHVIMMTTDQWAEIQSQTEAANAEKALR